MEAYLSRIVHYLAGQSWQIAILILVVAVITYLLRNRSAHVRYLLWLVVLAKCLVPPWYAVTLDVIPRTTGSPASPATAWLPSVAGRFQEAYRTPSDIGNAPSEGSPQAYRDLVVSPHRWSMPGRLGLIWLAGVVVYLTINLLRALRAEWWFRRKRRPLPEPWRQRIAEILGLEGAKDVPTVWLLDEIGQPFVWGLVRGSIYLPARFLDLDNPQQQRSVLLHELGHVVRFDAVVNLLQVAAQAMFWFHPFVWWASRQIRQEREKCCDEMAIARLGATPKDYGTAILSTLIQAQESIRPVPSLAVAGPVKNIEERIRTMLRPGKRFHKRPSFVAAAVVLLLALVTLPTTLVLTARAQTRPAEPKAPTAPQAGATPQNGDKPAADPWGWQPRYGARTFNSKMAFRVWVMVNYSGTQVVGNTPSATPLEIPPCWCWGVYVEAPVKDWSLLAREISLNEIPGLSLDSCTDSDLKHLVGLRDIRVLGLSGTAITDGGFESLKGLSKLEDLRLDKTPVTDAGLAHLKGLTKLRVLYLTGTRITDAGLQYLEGLTHLWGLVLDGTRITDAGLQHLAGLTELGWLRLNGTRITDAGLEHLKGRTALRALQLGGTQVTARGFAHLKALPHLESVSFDSRAIADDADLANLVDSLPRLTSLILGGSQITDAGLAHIRSLTGLTHLSLGGTQITDAGLAAIGSLTELQYLRLGKTRITDAGLEHLKDLPKLWALGLEGTQITDAGLEHLQGLKGLRKLYLNDIRIGDAGLEHLQGLAELVDLYVPGTQITDAGLEHLKGMTVLENLYLANTQITNKGLEHLKGLTGLKSLALGGTQVTDAAIQQLQQSLPNLTIIRDQAK